MASLKTIATDVLHGIEYPFKFIDKAAKVIGTIIKDNAQAKTIFITLTNKCEAIGGDVLKDIGEKGLTLVDDAATIALLQDLGSYVTSTVVPFIESAWGEIVKDTVAEPAPVAGE